MQVTDSCIRFASPASAWSQLKKADGCRFFNLVLKQGQAADRGLQAVSKLNSCSRRPCQGWKSTSRQKKGKRRGGGGRGSRAASDNQYHWSWAWSVRRKEGGWKQGIPEPLRPGPRQIWGNHSCRHGVKHCVQTAMTMKFPHDIAHDKSLMDDRSETSTFFKLTVLR